MTNSYCSLSKSSTPKVTRLMLRNIVGDLFIIFRHQAKTFIDLHSNRVILSKANLKDIHQRHLIFLAKIIYLFST